GSRRADRALAGRDRGCLRTRVLRGTLARRRAGIVRRRAGGRQDPLAVPVARRPAEVDAPRARSMAVAGARAGGRTARADVSKAPSGAERAPRIAGARARRGERLRIIVAGLIARYPLGGMAWHYLQYVLGLAALGYDVHYIEDSGEWPYDA